MHSTHSSSNEFTPTKRIGPFWRSFLNKGYKIEELDLGDVIIIRMISPEGKYWLTSTNISYPMVSSYAQKIAAHKYSMYTLAQKTGLRIPATELLTADQSSSDSKLLQSHPKLVVKPLDSYGSKGLTLNITSDKQLEEAINAAREVSSEVLIQEQVDGDELRFTVLSGKVVSVLRRQSPQVVGDGQKTIPELIDAENEARKLLSFEYISYPQLTEKIIDAKWFNDHSVPNKGEVVPLSRATMVSQGASIYDEIDTIHDSYKEAAELLAASLGTSFITVDMFVPDSSVPITNGNYWFNECNTAPALRLYYADKNGKGPQAAEAIVEAMDTMIRKGL